MKELPKELTTSESAEDNLFLNASALGASISAIDEMSKGLSAGIVNSGLLESYSRALTIQSSLHDQLSRVSNEVRLKVDDFNRINSKLLAPVSTAIADIGLSSIASQKLFSLGEVSQNIFATAERMNRVYLDVMNDRQSVVLKGLENIDSVTTLKEFAEQAVIPTQMIATGISDTLRANYMFPVTTDFDNLEITRSRIEVTEIEIEQHQQKLDALLILVHPKLVVYGRGAWNAYNSKNNDYVGQSFSSIRRLVDEVLRLIGPDDQVETTDYYKSGKGKSESNRPTREARMRYALGDKVEHERVQRLIKHIAIACKDLASNDHNPTDQDSFVYGTLIFTEGLLLSLLGELDL